MTIGIQVITIIAITYVSFFYTIASYVTSIIYRFIDNKITLSNDDESKSTSRLIFELLFSFVIMIKTLYFTKLVVEQIKFPLDGVYGYDHIHFSHSFLHHACEAIAIIWLMSDTSVESKIHIVNKRLHTLFL